MAKTNEGNLLNNARYHVKELGVRHFSAIVNACFCFTFYVLI